MEDFMITEILLNAGNQEFSEYLNKQWKTLREGVLSTDHVRNLAETYQSRLVNSGALLRDEKKWPNSPHNVSLDEMLDFHESRLAFLDGYYSMYLMECK